MKIELGELGLRYWRHGDEDDVRRNADDAAVASQLRDRFPHPYTDADARQWVEQNVRYPGVHSLAITLDDRVIGAIGAEYGFDIASRSAEVGYWLGVRWHGRGYATLALGAYCEELVRDGQIVRLWAGVLEGNEASMRVLQKCGFECEGVMRKAAFKAGRLLDQHIFGRVWPGD